MQAGIALCVCVCVAAYFMYLRSDGAPTQASAHSSAARWLLTFLYFLTIIFGSKLACALHQLLATQFSFTLLYCCWPHFYFCCWLNFAAVKGLGQHIN